MIFATPGCCRVAWAVRPACATVGSAGGAGGARRQGRRHRLDPARAPGSSSSRLAVDPLHQPRRPELLEAVVEPAPVPAEPVVARVAEREHREPRPVEPARVGGGQRLPEGGAVVGGVAVGERAGHDDEVGPVGRSAGRQSSIATMRGASPAPVSRWAAAAARSSAEPVWDAHRTTTCAPPSTPRSGPRRRGRVGLRGAREQARQEAVDPQRVVGVERRVRRQHGGARRAPAEAREEPGEVATFAVAEARRLVRVEPERRTQGADRDRARREAVGHDGSADRRSGRRATATGVSATAHTLNSGWNEIGSTASLVTAFTARYSPNRSFQWNGAKQRPGSTRSVTVDGQHGTTTPGRDLDRRSPSTSPSALGVGRVHLDERSRVELVELGDLAGLGHRVPLVLHAGRC